MKWQIVSRCWGNLCVKLVSSELIFFLVGFLKREDTENNFVVKVKIWKIMVSRKVKGFLDVVG